MQSMYIGISMEFDKSQLLIYSEILLNLQRPSIINEAMIHSSCDPMTNIVKANLQGVKVHTIVIVLIAVFYNSLRFLPIYLTLTPPVKFR